MVQIQRMGGGELEKVGEKIRLVDEGRNEVYWMSKEGVHLSTETLLTGENKWNFTVENGRLAFRTIAKIIIDNFQTYLDPNFIRYPTPSREKQWRAEVESDQFHSLCDRSEGEWRNEELHCTWNRLVAE